MAETSTDNVGIEDKRYRELMEAWNESRLLRATAIEEARLWCQVNKGTSTIEEGLRSCTPAELYMLLSRCAPGVWLYAYSWIEEAKGRLEAREEAARSAQAELAAMSTETLEVEE